MGTNFPRNIFKQLLSSANFHLSELCKNAFPLSLKRPVRAGSLNYGVREKNFLAHTNTAESNLGFTHRCSGKALQQSVKLL